MLKYIRAMFHITTGNQGWSTTGGSCSQILSTNGSDTVPMSHRRSLSILTWNVWFDDFEKSTRYSHILMQCERYNPDLVCFQEVTDSFIDTLRNQSNILSTYDVSDPLDGSTVNPYGVLTLCKKSLQGKFEFVQLTTLMGRTLLVSTIDTPSGQMKVGNVHLESLDSSRTRAQQMDEVRKALDGEFSAILCGDFNFCSYRNFSLGTGRPLENDAMAEFLPGFHDLWLEFNPTARIASQEASTLWRESSVDKKQYEHFVDRFDSQSLGYTFDTVRNEMLSKHRHEQMRYDRILYKCNTEKNSDPKGLDWEPAGISIIGTENIAEESPITDSYSTPPRKSARIIFPSDHFGLLAEFCSS